MRSMTAVTSALALVAALAPACYAQHLVTLYTVTNSTPVGLSEARDALYVAAADYGAGPGQIFQLRPPPAPGGAWTEAVLYSFGGPRDGSGPSVAPLPAAGGSLYGLTSAGGAYSAGTFYSLQPTDPPGVPWTENTLYSFDAPGANVGYPVSGLVRGPSGSFYVLTSGGANGGGALCQLSSPGWAATVLYSFPAGSPPLNSLAAGPGGVLYGTTSGGPGSQLGEVFRLTPPSSPGGAWTETLLHAFAKADADVGNPIALTVAADGTIYGTAYGYHPPLGAGASAAFRLTPPAALGGKWTYTLLTTPVYMEHLNTPLAMANGTLYGGITTGDGGSIFELQPPVAPGGAWTMTTLYTFTNGQVPIGNLVAGAGGVIYGTTAAAPGQPVGGTVYAITTK